MTLGDLNMKVAMLANFKLNLKRIKYDSETEAQLIKQAKRIIKELQEAIKDKHITKEQANEIAKEFGLSSFIKEVKGK